MRAGVPGSAGPTANSAAGRVIRFDPNVAGGQEGESWSGVWTVERPTLADFLADWRQDRLPFEPPAPPPTCSTPAGFSASWRV